MLIDAESLIAEAVLRCAVCIVGGGPAGITLLRELGRRGLDVCLLESGGLREEARTRALSAGTNRGRPYYPLLSSRSRVLGGTSVQWFSDVGLRSRPMDATDFDARPWIAYSGWPFGRERLEPYYRAAGEVCGFGATEFDLDKCSESLPGRPLQLDEDLVRTVAFRFAPITRFREMAEEDAKLPNVRVLLHANALSLEVSASSTQVDALRVATLGGKRFTVAANVYVLAAGGIENARLLLLSDSRFPAGLGNQNGLVGRYFMEHPHLLGGHIVTPGGAGFVPPPLYRPGSPDSGIPVGALALSNQVQKQEGVGNFAAFIHTTSQASRSRSVRSLRALRHIVRRGLWGRSALGHLRNVFTEPRALLQLAEDELWPRKGRRQLAELSIMSEQTPNPASRVTLSDKRDALGQRRASLTWELTEQDLRTIQAGQRAVDEALQKAGLGNLRASFVEESPPPPIGGGWHHMGTTRMSDAATLGVVDSDARVHGINNLFIAGSSIFPTAGYANPTLTLVALALKLAEHLGRLELPRRVPAVATAAGGNPAKIATDPGAEG